MDLSQLILDHLFTAPTPIGYQFSNGSAINPAASLLAGTYTYTVTDGAGCQATGTSTVLEPSKIVIVGKVRNATCNVVNGAADGSVKITYSGGTPPDATQNGVRHLISSLRIAQLVYLAVYTLWW